ncbi:MAG: NAD-dependent epimerase/dehydratase family protein [Solirubrobacteraceae bacterium]
MSEERRVLVTGGSGLIGSHVVDALVQDGGTRAIVLDRRPEEASLAGALASGRVQLEDCDLRDEARVCELMEGVDAVIHLAAMLTLESNGAPREALEVNVLATHAMLEAAVRLKVPRFVFGSSVGIYGQPPEGLLVDEQGPIGARSLYGAAKYAVELYLRAFHDMFGLSCFALRFGTVYGPRQHRRGFFPRALYDALEAVDAGRTPRVEGDPQELHDFLYVGDAARAVLLALESPVDQGAANIVSARPVTLRQVVETLLREYGAPAEVEWAPRGEGAPGTSRRFDGGHAERTIGFEPSVPLERGLRAFIDWRAATLAGGTAGALVGAAKSPVSASESPVRGAGQ